MVLLSAPLLVCGILVGGCEAAFVEVLDQVRAVVIAPSQIPSAIGSAPTKASAPRSSAFSFSFFFGHASILFVVR